MAKKIWLCVALGWTLVIAVLCLVSFNELPQVKIEGADKYVHATFHFLFAIFWYQYFTADSVMPKRRVLGKVLSLSIIYGCLIEIAQECFTTTRHADIKDVLANFTGAALAVLLLALADRSGKSRSV